MHRKLRYLRLFRRMPIIHTNDWADHCTQSNGDETTCVSLKDGGSFPNQDGVITVDNTPYAVVDPCDSAFCTVHELYMDKIRLPLRYYLAAGCVCEYAFPQICEGCCGCLLLPLFRTN